MRPADITRADIARADITRADIARADIARAYIMRTDIAMAEMSGTRFERCALGRRKLSTPDARPGQCSRPIPGTGECRLRLRRFGYLPKPARRSASAMAPLLGAGVLRRCWFRA
ncbi:hypothetical protein NWFMUON74_21640 [Nocardia wallacei]|uniref:Pentapeptide repeat protein n=1 Tax=Nocardia wallacei TaxID=480035 RepID=A0A7G1KGG2_9NOCA|nr:hypothetical protein NWFMUON74_21640 [Nocardia wallacei]